MNSSKNTCAYGKNSAIFHDLKYSQPVVRILHVVSGVGMGGIEQYLINLYRHIDREIVQFDFVIHRPCSNGFEDEIRDLGGRIYYQQLFSKRGGIDYITEVKRFLKNHQEYRIIHIHMRTVAAVWTIEAKHFNKTTIVHSHSTTNGYGLRGIVKNIIQFPVRWYADYFMGCSVAANEWMFGKRIAHSDHCIVLNNGIDVDKFRFDPEKRRQVRSSIGIDDDIIVLGNVGRLVDQKNQMFLLDIFKNIVDNYSKRRYKLIIVGDGPLQGKLMHRIQELGLQQYTIMLGWRPDVNDLLSAFDVFMLPSKDEGLGIAAIEAQASGLPVLCSEAIPREAMITEHCKTLPTDGFNDWCDGIFSIENSLYDGMYKNRIEYNREIKEAGFDIGDVSRRLTRYYMDLLDD